MDPIAPAESFVPANWPKWTDAYAVMNNGEWGDVFHEAPAFSQTRRLLKYAHDSLNVSIIKNSDDVVCRTASRHVHADLFQ